jgi:hypothetical protein
VRLIGRVVFGLSLDVGHFFVPVSGGARAVDFPLDAKLSFRRHHLGAILGHLHCGERRRNR